MTSIAPPPYLRLTSFTGSSPYKDATLGVFMDDEFNAVQVTVNALKDRLALIQRDDGNLQNASVTQDQLGGGLTAQDINFLTSVGINASNVQPNKLTVGGKAALFSSAGAIGTNTDFRLAVSKAAPANTASILFQDNFSSRAEIGLTGDNSLHFKTSADGTVFVDALRINSAGAVTALNNIIAGGTLTTLGLMVTGAVTMPQFPGLTTNVAFTGIPGLYNPANTGASDSGLMFYNEPATAAAALFNTLRLQRKATYTGGTSIVASNLWVLTETAPSGALHEWGALSQMNNKTGAGQSLSAQNVALQGTIFKMLREATVTITNASPGVVTWTDSNFVVGDRIQFKNNSDTLPNPLAFGVTYYVLSAGLTANTFRISLTYEGAAIDTTTNGSGTHKAVFEVGLSWGSNIVAQDNTGIVNPTAALVGQEIGCQVIAGAGTDTGFQRVGLGIVCGVYPGSDAGAHIGTAMLVNTAGGATIDRGIHFLTGPYGTLIGGGALNAAKGIDWSLLTFSSDAIKTPGFIVNNAGAATADALTVTNAAALNGSGTGLAVANNATVGGSLTVGGYKPVLALSTQNGGNTNNSNSGSGSDFNHNLTFVIPANFMVAARAFRVTAHYRLTTGSGPPNLIHKLKLGSTTLLASAAVTPSASMTNVQTAFQWVFQATAAPGASVNVECSPVNGINAVASTALSSTAMPVAIATNAAQTVTLSTQWSAVGTGTTTATLSQLIVEALN